MEHWDARAPPRGKVTKGGKAFTTSATEEKNTFVPHYKGNVAEFPRPNPLLTGDIASG